MLRNLNENLGGEFSSTKLGYPVVRISRLDNAFPGLLVACVASMSFPFPGGDIEQVSEQAGEQRGSLLRSRMSRNGGALRDIPKNGCEGD